MVVDSFDAGLGGGDSGGALALEILHGDDDDRYGDEYRCDGNEFAR